MVEVIRQLALVHEVAEIHLSRSTIFRRVKVKTFPQPLRLSTRRVVWQLSDVQRWMAARDRPS